MKKSDGNTLNCLVRAAIKQIIIILQLIILLQLAVNFVYKATDRQNIADNISVDQERFKEIYDTALYNDEQSFKTLQTYVEYNGDIICLQIAKDSDNWLKQEYRKADKVWLDAINKSDDGVQATLAGWEFMEPITGLSASDMNIVEVSEQRYWNGVELILKTLLSIVSFKTVISILIILEWLLFISLLYRIYKLLKLREIKYLTGYIVQIACVFIGTNQFLVYNWPARMMVPTITIISQHLLLQICTKYKDNRYAKLSHILILYAVTGSVICLFDYIYSPVLQILTLLMIEYSVINRVYSIDSEDSIFIKIYKPVMWFCGYFGTWTTKFIVVYVYNREQFATIQNKASDWSVQATDKIKYLLEYLIQQFGFIQIALVIMLIVIFYISYKTDLSLKEF